MNRFSLDPRKPVATCSAADCAGCPLQDRLQCHFSSHELLGFFAIAFPPFILGGTGIARINAWLLLPWIGLTVIYFGFIEILVMCSHCPHYEKRGAYSLRCWANYGSPKLRKYRPGPMTWTEIFVFSAGLFLIVVYPLGFLVAGAQWLLLALFVAAVIVMGSLMSTLMCKRCMNFACPLNRVDREVKEAFFKLNPVIRKVW